MRKPEDDFIVRHTRMTLTGFGRFDLAYLYEAGRRYTKAIKQQRRTTR
jgi:hypothetical protein